LRTIDDNRMGIVFVVDEQRHVVGVLTDGDIRAAFVRGVTLHSPVSEAMTASFTFGEVGMSADVLRARLPGRTRVMPVLDADRRLVDYASGDHLPETTA
jgi:CBS domain-containing protein